MATDLATENERLREELAQAKAELESLRNPEEVTLNSLAATLQALTESQTVRLEGRLSELLGEDGPRGPPPSAAPLAETIHDMEDLGMTEEQVNEAREIFDTYDEHCTGVISNSTLMSILRLLGEDPAQQEVDAMVAEVDENRNGDLTLNEFLTVYSTIVRRHKELDPDSPNRRPKRALRKMGELSFYGVGGLKRWAETDGDRYGGDVISHPAMPCHRRNARRLVTSKGVESVFYLCICLSAVNSGLQTYPEYEFSDAVVLLGHFTNLMFALECFLKMAADSGSCSSFLGYLGDPWNLFDLSILTALLILTPLTASGTGVGAVRILRILRLLRALRVLRAAKVFPQLSLVLETLIRSTWSVIYILLFLLLIAYIFAIVGVTVFGQNDPFFFGTLGRAMTSLFRIATGEGWTKLMYFQLYGCDGMGTGYASYVAESAAFITATSQALDDGSIDCDPEIFPYFGRLYFGFLMLNLFIGVIIDSMMQMKSEVEEKQTEDKAWAVASRLKDGPQSKQRFREMEFDNPVSSGDSEQN